MAILLGFVILGLALILQTSVVSQITLLYGPADLVLLALLGWILHARVKGIWEWGLIAGALVGFASQLPMWLPILGYLLVTGLAQLLQSRVWQVPVMSLITTILVGTFVVQGMALVYLQLSAVPITLAEAFNLVILPSAILNLLLALPVYGLMGEIAKRFYPPEVET